MRSYRKLIGPNFLMGGDPETGYYPIGRQCPMCGHLLALRSKERITYANTWAPHDMVCSTCWAIALLRGIKTPIGTVVAGRAYQEPGSTRENEYTWLIGQSLYPN